MTTDQICQYSEILILTQLPDTDDIFHFDSSWREEWSLRSLEKHRSSWFSESLWALDPSSFFLNCLSHKAEWKSRPFHQASASGMQYLQACSNRSPITGWNPRIDKVESDEAFDLPCHQLRYQIFGADLYFGLFPTEHQQHDFDCSLLTDPPIRVLLLLANEAAICFLTTHSHNQRSAIHPKPQSRLESRLVSRPISHMCTYVVKDLEVGISSNSNICWETSGQEPRLSDQPYHTQATSLAPDFQGWRYRGIQHTRSNG